MDSTLFEISNTLTARNGNLPSENEKNLDEVPMDVTDDENEEAKVPSQLEEAAISSVDPIIDNNTEANSIENTFDFHMSGLYQEQQMGPILIGPGARKDRTLFNAPKLTSSQREALQKAKKYAMEQSIKSVLLKQTISHQQQQMQNQQNSVQRQQAITLMCRIYVGSINFEIKEETIRQAFQPFGPIKSMSMPYDAVGKHHKGFAFLEYETPEAASLCLEQMNGIMIQGYSIKVGRPSNMPQAQMIIDKIVEESKSFNRIYIAAIHPDLTENDIKSVFEAFGRITYCQLAYDPMMPSKHKSYGYLEYESLQSALDAISGMNMFDLGGQLLRVGRVVTPPTTYLSPSSSSGNLPTASAIAAAAITAQITALEAISKPVEAKIIDEKVESPVAPKPPQPPSKPSKFGGFSSTTPSNIPPPSIYIPPSSVKPSVVEIKKPASKSKSKSKSSSKEKDKAQQVLLDMPEMQTLQQQEDMQIKGHQARHMVMQKLLRAKETRVVALHNMVSAEEVDEYLEEEVTDECSKYGTVEKVVIYQEKQGEKEEDAVLVKIFVEFSHQSEAERAIQSLNGRFFGGKTVKALSYDQHLYDNHDFSA